MTFIFELMMHNVFNTGLGLHYSAHLIKTLSNTQTNKSVQRFIIKHVLDIYTVFQGCEKSKDAIFDIQKFKSVVNKFYCLVHVHVHY